ncbi:MAG TPA: BTAD domain-containing putative transcriptional regulator, partial [Miltoncostaeaceae bacterium]|nr:BTAD domain-containing putative transcriptional regulator [Miltoncostaeaceae bacterium]
MLRARLFGGLRVEVGGREVPPAPGLRPRSLLAFLLLHPGPHPRARLAGRFWPDVLDTSARGSLRSALWAVRESLAAAGGEAYLHADRTHVGLAPGLPREVDAERFAALAEAGDAASLEAAVALAGDPLLPDLADDWVLEEQDRHRDRLIAVLERLATLAEEAGDPAAAVRWTRSALEHDRLREGVHRALMRRLAAAGDGPQALAEYVRLRDALAAELGMRPSDDTRALARAIRDEAGAHVGQGAAAADPR